MASAANLKSAIGRFEIVRALAQSNAGDTYLARDTRLDRPVVLKTLAPGPDPGRGRSGMAMVLDAARQASTLSHPNIVTLLDAGEDAGLAFLVFEFVEGQTLEALLAAQGKLSVDLALGIGVGLCRALVHAHERNVQHGAISAGNVRVTAEGTARLMGFGAGLPAPSLLGEPPSAAGDIRDLAALLVESLTGGKSGAPDAQSALALLAPGQIDERLAHLLRRALHPGADDAIAGAAELGDALADLLAPVRPEAADEGSQATLEYLLRRIRLKGEFPALSATISAVNRAAASDREPVGVLCNSILKDIALTGRLLKIVNGSHLNQFGGSISTVSRAIAILGYDAVRNVSMSLALFEHMHDRANAVALKDQIVGIYFSGLLAREFAGSAGVQDAEQAFICAMFHRLGKLLATFYLHEEAQVVERHVQSRGWNEERASREVLGLSYEDLGIGVGRAWNLPDEIVQSMRGFAGHARACPDQQVEKLRMIAGLANELTDIVQRTDDGERKEQLQQLVRRYGPAMGVTDRSLVAAVDASVKSLARDAESLSHGLSRSPFLRSAGSWLLTPGHRASAESAPDGQSGRAAAAGAGNGRAGGEAPPEVTDVATATQRVVTEARLDPGFAAPTAQAEPASRHAALAAGVQDITNTMVGDHTLNDVLRIILETMYRAIGFQRVLLFSLDPREKSLRCRFGFGTDADVITQKRVAVPLHGNRDLFYAAVVMGADLCIDDLESDKIRPHVPQWYKAAIGARGIVLLPIVNKKRTLGLIYADSDSPAVLRFSAEELSLLKTLRNQALLAMRQNT
jgi:HD-like signal output (HDOD) protein